MSKKVNLKLSLVVILFAVSIMNCEKNSSIVEPDNTSENEDTDNPNFDNKVSNINSHDAEEDYIWDVNNEIDVALQGNNIIVDGNGATVEGSKVFITSAGSYNIHGSLTDGQIIVNTDDDDIVRLILNNVDINSSTTSPIYIDNAKKTMIVLAEGSTNFITDPATYVFESADEDEPNAAIFSKDNLTLFGEGNLTISANYNDAITSKDGLVITSGRIIINAIDDGIRGKDYLIIKSGSFEIESGGDGLKSDNREDIGTGCILIEKGTINIRATKDAIQAANDIDIANGIFNLVSGGGSNSSVGIYETAKAIKATDIVQIDGGNFTINSADDAIHSNNSIIINSGNFIIATSDDGIHADSTLTLNGGDIAITKSYEGLESAIINLNAGQVNLVSSDDGINVSGSKDGSEFNNDPWGYNSSSGDHYLYINRGYYVLNSNGDGIDANGSIEMTGGNVIINGPVANMNGALDYDGYFNISGGFIIAVGSSGMAEAPDETSSQNCLLFSLNSTQDAGTLIMLQTTSGAELFTFAPCKEFTSVAYSSPALSKGTSYQIYYGGSATGTVTDGLYTNGTYSPGAIFESFTISSVITKINVRSGGRP